MSDKNHLTNQSLLMGWLFSLPICQVMNLLLALTRLLFSMLTTQTLPVITIITLVYLPNPVISCVYIIQLLQKVFLLIKALISHQINLKHSPDCIKTCYLAFHVVR